MNNKSVFGLTILSIIAAVGVAAAMVLIFALKQPYNPPEDALSVEEIISTGDVEGSVNIVGGSVSQGDVQTAEGMYCKDLTAVEEDGYVFVYWLNGTTKLSGDKTITIRSTSLNSLQTAVAACVPVFWEIDKNIILINTAEDFVDQVVADTQNNETEGNIYKLTADINVPSLTGSLGVFRGVLDGNNHAISGFKINGSGLFDSLNGGVIKNLILSDCEVASSTAQFIGSFCGSINSGLISRCLSYADVKNTLVGGKAGGIVGACSSTDVRSMIYSSGFYGTVTAETAQQQIVFNGTITATTTESCAVYRPKNNGAINIL